MTEATRTLVIGDGGWGTALALALHRAGRAVTVWGHDAEYAGQVARDRSNPKFLPGVDLPEAIRWTGDCEAALEGADEFYSVVPTQFVRPTLARFGSGLQGLPAISASKGLEIRTLERPSQILEEMGLGPVAVLSGPSHAEEVARGLATSVVVASRDIGLAHRTQERLGGEEFRLYSSPDVAGVELGGALKNIIAVAAGISDGLGLGDNAKAALASRGLIEIARYGASAGARRETFFGLSGAGDLMVTCYSRHSRNRSFGERIGRGEKPDEVLAGMEKVCEGVWTCRAIHGAAADRGVEMPITEQLYAVLFEGRSPEDAVRELMLRPLKSELEEAL